MGSEFRSIWEDSFDKEEQARLLESLKEEVRDANAAKSILMCLADENEGFTKAEIIQFVRCRRQRVLRALSRLLELQKVFRSDGGRKGKPFRYRLKAWNQK
jgi:hypothetical protein